MPSSVMRGACPGKMPSSPSAPGRVTSLTGKLSSCRSGVTTTSCKESGIRLRARLHLFGFFERFLDCADHVKRLLRNIVVLALNDFLKAANRVFDLYVLAFEAGELRRNEHRLRKELF